MIKLFKEKNSSQFSCKLPDKEPFVLGSMPEIMLLDILYELGWVTASSVYDQAGVTSFTELSPCGKKELRIDVHHRTQDSDWCFKVILYLNHQYLMCCTIQAYNPLDLELSSGELTFKEHTLCESDYKCCVKVLEALEYAVEVDESCLVKNWLLEE